MTKSLWRDGTLRETRLVVNGLPDAGEVGLPDEVFVGAQGSEVQIIRRPPGIQGSSEVWGVNTSPEYGNYELFHDFEDAFAHALALVREAVEGDDD